MNNNPPPYSRIIKVIKNIRHNKWNYLDFSYFRKWILVGFVLGIAAGLGAIALYLAVAFFTSLFLVSVPAIFHRSLEVSMPISITHWLLKSPG